MKNIILFFCFILFPGLMINAQYIQNGSTSIQTENKPHNGTDVSVSYMGITEDGYVKYPQSISIEYSGKVSGKDVKVKYQLSTEANFQLEKSNNDLFYNGDSLAKLSVRGNITQDKNGIEVTLATFTEIIYTSSPKKFTGWIISKDSKLGISNTASLSKKGLNSSSGDYKFTGKCVAFYRIEKDFTITFIAQPISLQPKTIAIPNKK